MDKLYVAANENLFLRPKESKTRSFFIYLAQDYKAIENRKRIHAYINSYFFCAPA